MRQWLTGFKFESLWFAATNSSCIHTCVWVFGIDDCNWCSNSGVVKHHYLIVVTGELWRVVIYILHFKYNVCLARTSSSISRLDYQVVLCFFLPIQECESEQLTCLWQIHEHVISYRKRSGWKQRIWIPQIFQRVYLNIVSKNFFRFFW